MAPTRNRAINVANVLDLAKRYNDAWNARDVAAVLRIYHPEGSYYDAFWGERCSGKDLASYFKVSFEVDTRWYRPVGDTLLTPNGFVHRYDAFDVTDTEGITPVFRGADIVTTADGLILTVSSFYVDLDPVDLIEVAKTTESRHAASDVAPLGMSVRTAARIKRKLAELADTTDTFLSPDLTVTHLADKLGCNYMHLFHVLEEEFGTSFTNYVNECRVRYATNVIVEGIDPTDDFGPLSKECGFDSVDEFEQAFERTFNMSPADYAKRFRPAD